jgi:hypothetical protein
VTERVLEAALDLVAGLVALGEYAEAKRFESMAALPPTDLSTISVSKGYISLQYRGGIG